MSQFTITNKRKLKALYKDNQQNKNINLPKYQKINQSKNTNKKGETKIEQIMKENMLLFLQDSGIYRYICNCLCF